MQKKSAQMSPERGRNSLGAKPVITTFARLTAALGWLLLALTPGLLVSGRSLADAPPQTGQVEHNLSVLGSGDRVKVTVFQQPDIGGEFTVAGDGAINVPLAGHVLVAGNTPDQAADRIAKALKDGEYLKDPQVTLTLITSQNLRVSILGEVKNPARYPIDPNTTVFDLLAQAGGLTPNGGDVVYLIRQDGHGGQTRREISIKATSNTPNASLTETLQGGDEVMVPAASQYYVDGEVNRADHYRIEPGMTIMQAIARAGGVTPRGSDRRIEIKHAGQEKWIRANPNDLVQPDDSIHVKERIF